MTYEEMKKAYEEAPRVQNTEYNLAVHEMRLTLEKAATEHGISDRYISIYDDSCMSPIKMGVNWSAIGTTNPADTRSFAEVLAIAADLAENFKYNGFVIDYTV